MNRRQAPKRTRSTKVCNRIDDIFKAVGDRVKPSEAFIAAGNFRLRKRPVDHSVFESTSHSRCEKDTDRIPNKSSRLDINADFISNSVNKSEQRQQNLAASASVPSELCESGNVINQSAGDRDLKSQEQFPLHRDGTSAFISLSASHDVNSRLTLESYREQIHDMLVSTQKFDVLPLLHRKCFDKVQLDPIEQHFSKSDKDITSTVQATHNLKAGKYEQKRSLRPRGTQNSISIQSPTGDSIPSSVAQKLSCEIKMRVKIQYKSHQHVLSMINSRKHGKDERQFDQFFQATSLLRARDTGCVVCDISFTDVTYLGAFWRDYINGSLQNALKTVFLTEMMRQTAGDEELDVFVSVDEEDFKSGQLKLLKVLKEKESVSYNPYNNCVVSAGVARLEL